MNTKLIVLFAFGFLMCLGITSASTNGTFEGNETNTINNTYAEFDVVADISATQWWAEVSLNTSEIDFGHIENGNLSRKSYQIKARGNVDIKVIPTLAESDDSIFSNLYFSRTTTGWKKIGSENFGLVFNLTQNKGLWTVIGSSDSMKNLSASDKGSQNIQLDLTDFRGIIPFDQNYRNTVKFVVVPDWTSVIE
jgi:hypothetical protein